jgi:hypothetical protein
MDGQEPGRRLNSSLQRLMDYQRRIALSIKCQKHSKTKTLDEPFKYELQMILSGDLYEFRPDGAYTLPHVLGPSTRRSQ